MRILLVTDSHLAPTAAPCNANWHAAKAFAQRVGADLTIHLGDITFDGIDAPAHHTWARDESANWPTPLRFLPGNHDIGDNPPAPNTAAPQPLDLALLSRYRHQYGPDRWAIDAEFWRLIGINSQLFGSETAEEVAQWDWLERELATAHGRPIALFSHKPIFLNDPGEPTSPASRYLPIGPRLRLLELLQPADLRLIVSGHAHQFLDRNVVGARHIWLPATSFIIPDSIQERVGEKITGLGLMELDPVECHFDLIRPRGMGQTSLLDPAFAELREARATSLATRQSRV
jgi:3',5'-cyclic AMP phosphodiesterase CpdA